MPSVCKAVIKAKGSYFEESQIYFNIFNTFLITIWFHMIVLMYFLLFYNNSEDEWIGVCKRLTGTVCVCVFWWQFGEVVSSQYSSISPVVFSFRSLQVLGQVNTFVLPVGDCLWELFYCFLGGREALLIPAYWQQRRLTELQLCSQQNSYRWCTCVGLCFCPNRHIINNVIRYVCTRVEGGSRRGREQLAYPRLSNHTRGYIERVLRAMRL